MLAVGSNKQKAYASHMVQVWEKKSGQMENLMKVWDEILYIAGRAKYLPTVVLMNVLIQQLC